MTSCKLALSGFHIPQYLNFGTNFKDLWVTDLGTYSPGVAYLYEFNAANGKQLAKLLKAWTSSRRRPAYHRAQERFKLSSA